MAVSERPPSPEETSLPTLTRLTVSDRQALNNSDSSDSLSADDSSIVTLRQQFQEDSQSDPDMNEDKLEGDEQMDTREGKQE